MAKLIMCMDNEGAEMLVIGKTYTVIDSSGTRYFINLFEEDSLNDIYGWYNRSRFVEV